MADADQRLFVAVPLPADAVAECQALIDEIRSGPLGSVPRWVHVPNLHLTVRFLGATPPGLVDAVADAVEAAASGQPAFDVILAGAGSFPGDRKPRTLWLGIERGVEELGALARRVDEQVTSLGWTTDDRAYRPHLTVARLDAASRADGVAVAAALANAAAGWRTQFVAAELVLFRSHLGGGPPRHDAVRRVPLVG